jgi:hypothetical protein
MILVDLCENCIEACKLHFSKFENVIYHVNDGVSLEMISDSSIDFVFSFDSLVHAEADVIQAYISQLAKKMKPNAVGWIHHSNAGNFYSLHSKIIKKLPLKRYIPFFSTSSSTSWAFNYNDHKQI